MPFVIGIVLALTSVSTAAWIGLERRSFYTTLLMVIATYYVLFAIMGESSHAVLIESIVMGVFLLFAAIGARTSMWLVVAGLGAHGVFDFIHGALVANPGMPSWWPAFCASYDIVAAIALAWLLRRDSLRSEPHLKSGL